MMNNLLGMFLFALCIAVAPLRADEVKPLQLKEGEKYASALFDTNVAGDKKHKAGRTENGELGKL